MTTTGEGLRWAVTGVRWTAEGVTAELRATPGNEVRVVGLTAGVLAGIGRQGEALYDGKPAQMDGAR